MIFAVSKASESLIFFNESSGLSDWESRWLSWSKIAYWTLNVNNSEILFSLVKSYMDILAAGGSKKPEKLLLEHGFDIKSPKFWQEGFNYVGQQVKALSSLN